ncbi:hypothetical protein Tco_1038810 [Tanacetum coccineum]
MKFGKILKLHIEVIPSNLAWDILLCYDAGNKCLLLNGDRVDITRDLVFEIFGFPKGDLEISFVKRSNYDHLGNCYPGLMDCFWSLKKDQRWLFQKTKGNQSVIEYRSTELLKKVNDEHLRLKNFGNHFNNEKRFFCDNKESEVDMPEFETNDMLLLANEQNDEANSESDNTLYDPEENNGKENESLESKDSSRHTSESFDETNNEAENENQGIDDSIILKTYMFDVHIDEVVITLASGDKGQGFDPHSLQSQMSFSTFRRTESNLSTLR